jgi:hypothetical protein
MLGGVVVASAPFLSLFLPLAPACNAAQRLGVTMEGNKKPPSILFSVYSSLDSVPSGEY